MEDVLALSVHVENSLRDLIGRRISLTVCKNKKRTVYREGIVYEFDPCDMSWMVHNDQGDFSITFDDFVKNKIFVE
jgi:hypothetical protein